MRSIWRIFCFALLAAAVCLAVSSCSAKSKEELLREGMEAICAGYGLENVQVELTEYEVSEDWARGETYYTAKVKCDGFSGLSGGDMYDCMNALCSVRTENGDASVLNLDFSVRSGGHSYTYKEGDKKYERPSVVYCDGAEVYFLDNKISEAERKREQAREAVREAALHEGDSGARHTDVEAFTVAQIIVRDHLKAPGSALFCKASEASVSNDGDRYTVIGWVEAENSFGGSVRQTFLVTYQAVKNGNDVGYRDAFVVFS